MSKWKFELGDGSAYNTAEINMQGEQACSLLFKDGRLSKLGASFVFTLHQSGSFLLQAPSMQFDTAICLFQPSIIFCGFVMVNRMMNEEGEHGGSGCQADGSSDISNSLIFALVSNNLILS